MKTRIIPKIVLAGFALAMTFTFSCSGDDGEPGKPGSVVTIGTDGYWYIDGVKTDIKAAGTDGQDCDVEDDSAYLIIKCGGIEKARWPKAMCETEAYDPENMICKKGILGVKIGAQVWMAKNLNIETANSKCYDDNEDNCDIYGRLYNWTEANTTCPTGWHLPTDAEWNGLIETAGGAKTAGKALKANSVWTTNTGTNDHNFSALPGGYNDGANKEINEYGYWWSDKEHSTNNTRAYYWQIFYGSDIIEESFANKTNLYSVRCIMD